MHPPTPAILVLVIALIAVIGAVTGGDDAPVLIYRADGDVPGAWHGERLPDDRLIRFILDADALGRLRAVSPQAVRGIDPAFDFAKELLLIAYLGEAPTGGYGIQVRSVEWTPPARGEEGKVTVRLALWSPGPDAFVTQAFTYPRDVVALPKADWPAAALEAINAGRVETVILDRP